jgi:hypothetical protein
MDLHNYPIDYAVRVTDDRVRFLLRERSLRQDLGRRVRAADDRPVARRLVGWTLRIVLAAPLIVGGAGFLLGWLGSKRG